MARPYHLQSLSPDKIAELQESAQRMRPRFEELMTESRAIQQANASSSRKDERRNRYLRLDYEEFISKLPPRTPPVMVDNRYIISEEDKELMRAMKARRFKVKWIADYFKISRYIIDKVVTVP